MNSVQLELNIENLSPPDLRLQEMQKQIDAACESMGKVRRKLFCEIGELKKLIAALQEENHVLQEKLKELSDQKIKWTYAKEGCLFELESYQDYAIDSRIVAK